MNSPRQRGRRIPPKARYRPIAPPGSGAVPDGGDDVAYDSSNATPPSPVRPASRAQNRAAKRAAGPRPVRGGGVRGGSNRGYNPAIIGLAIAAVVVVGAVIAIGNPFGTPAASPSASAAAGSCPTSQPAPLPSGEIRYVTIETSLGDIVIRVDGALSPIAAGNFVALADCGFYDGVVFHRTPTLQDGTPFVIQGGDPDGTGSGGPGYTIEDEPVTATYRRGTVAMARSQQPDSQGSQFFVVLDDKSAAPLASANTYAIFGEVISGMDVADAIHAASAGVELPTNPIEMISVTVSDEPPPSPSPGASASPGASQSGSPSASPAASPATSP
jgi:cyclophilin family peptidyl-prolyl cis-trans isomerase